MHEHYNAEGELVGTTRIVRESVWDDEARAESEALWEMDALICPKCGNPREDCSDPAHLWYPQRTTCYADAALEVVRWKWDEKHKGAQRTAKKPMLPTDGVRLWVSQYDLTPDDKFI